MRTSAEIAGMREMDREILMYVRESQQLAPVGADTVHAYLTGIRRREVRIDQVQDRLDDLVDENKLKMKHDWIPGEGRKTFYRITSRGRDVLDGVIPPEG